MSSEFKITLLKETSTIFKWWVEGFENCVLTDEDIEEISKCLDTCKTDIIEKMTLRKQIEEMTN